MEGVIKALSWKEYSSVCFGVIFEITDNSKWEMFVDRRLDGSLAIGQGKNLPLRKLRERTRPYFSYKKYSLLSFLRGYGFCILITKPFSFSALTGLPANILEGIVHPFPETGGNSDEAF